ncbi:small acid-soluble spore protein SspI [Vulcanibacillus modesticaldus]|uniref:Small, acid-soluble spore protein I n=1 Tax=Vulcanibacillus modesticaldus TaxID=337097 RepID=A0A1D2YUK1_9BACI|nr:small acid-soluble spore protein SspI [Vulcanibacillus modesticaldus]OEF99341.1 small acid-soluble spore protein SspI [Vulcanibacillus modesticaldus]
MNLDLRQAILNNIKNKSEEQLMDMVKTAIEDHDEKTLPGLGVIFEVIWQNTDEQIKESMIETLSKNL